MPALSTLRVLARIALRPLVQPLQFPRLEFREPPEAAAAAHQRGGPLQRVRPRQEVADVLLDVRDLEPREGTQRLGPVGVGERAHVGQAPQVLADVAQALAAGHLTRALAPSGAHRGSG
jgi:hypothetical protein